MANWFASPAALWLGLLVAPLLLLYMLRHKPVRKRVPAVVLWTGVARAQIATSPFQRLKKSLSLLLMLLALTALVLALAGLRIPGGETRGVPVTIVIDTTASMNAFEPGGSRMTLAKARARDVIDAAGNSAITVLAWDGNLRAVGPGDAEAGVALANVEGLEPAHFGASDASLVRALEQIDTDGKRRVVLISDHIPGELSRAYFVPAGTPKLNVGFVSANLSEPRPGQVDLFFAVDLKGSEKPLRVSVLLERVQARGAAELVDARDVTLASDKRNAITFTDMRPGLYRATLKLDDGLMLDNTAYLRYSELPVQDVVITGEVPDALARVIDAIEATMGIVRRLQSGREDQDATSYIFGDSASSGTQPRLPSAYLAPHAAPPGVLFAGASDVDDGATRPSPSFLWRGAGTPDIRIPAVIGIDSARRLAPVLESGPGAALALIDRDDGMQDLLVAFPFDETATGFTGKVSFLIFWANWFDHVRRQRDPLPRAAISTRESVRVRPLVGRNDFLYAPLTDGHNSATPQPGTPGRALHFDEVGVYEFTDLEETDLPLIGVGLLDARESDISLGEVAQPDVSELTVWMDSFDDAAERSDLDLRGWLALLGGALLLFDWFWFRRKYAMPRADDTTPGEAGSRHPKARPSTRRHTSRVRA
ncbi:MAG: VWA domain-containing protein [Planctomycetes bacterium]|nr:VWA domain-containing protein [Planctomycetota bacterium]